MTRYIFAALLIPLILVVIGFAYTTSIPNLSLGTIGEYLSVEREKRYSVTVPAVLTAAESNTYSKALFVGDVLLARNVEFLMNQHNGFYPFAGLHLPDMSESPAVFGNFEAAIPRTHQPTPTGMIDFSVATSALPYLYAAGYTHLSLANNHSFDFGTIDFEHTRVTLQQDFKIFGEPNELSASSISYIDLNGVKTAVIGINALKNIEDADLRRVLATAGRSSEIQIVYVHWGEEYALRHSSSQRDLAEKFVEAGADLIVGHHPHVVQGIELIDDVPVMYSLGNYIFDQYFSKDVKQGLVLSVDYENGWLLNLIPVTSEVTLSQPALMNTKSHAEFLDVISRKSSEALAASVQSGVIDLRGNVATSDKVAIMHDTF